MRELLLEGELVRRDLLDVHAVEQAFCQTMPSGQVQMRLSEMTALELWLRSWRR
jgi:hypothetical protein